MLESALPSGGNTDKECQYCPLQLHEFTIHTLVLTLGDSLGQAIVHQTLYLAADATRLTLVAEGRVNILRRERIGQSSIPYPRLLLVCAT